MARRPANIPPVGPYAQCQCLRCTHQWEAVNPQKRPECCPRCRSRAWDRPPTKEHDRRPTDPPNPKWITRGECCGECGRPLTKRMLRERQRKESALRAQFSTDPAPVPTQPITLAGVKQSLAEASRRHAVDATPAHVRDPRELPPGLTPPPQVPDMMLTVPMPRELTPRRAHERELAAAAEQPQDTPERVASRQQPAPPAGSLSAELESELERNHD